MSIPDSDPCRVCFSNLPPRITEYIVLKILRQFGELVDFNFPIHNSGSQQGESLGYCFTTYSDKNSAQTAIKKLNGFSLHGYLLSAHFAKPRKKDIESAKANLEEVQRLQALEENFIKEQELAVRLYTPILPTQNEEDSSVSSNIFLSTKTQTQSCITKTQPPLAVNSFSSNIPDLYGKLGQLGTKNFSPPTKKSSALGSANTALAIKRIESTLRRLSREQVIGVQPALLRDSLGVGQNTHMRPHPALASVLATHQKTEDKHNRCSNPHTRPHPYTKTKYQRRPV